MFKSLYNQIISHYKSHLSPICLTLQPNLLPSRWILSEQLSPITLQQYPAIIKQISSKDKLSISQSFSPPDKAYLTRVLPILIINLQSVKHKEPLIQKELREIKTLTLLKFQL